MKDKKCITQATFDAVVKENMNEFGMTPEEAVADAVSQFEAQGVSLHNIVTKFDAKEDNGAVLTPSEKATKMVEELKNALEAEEGSEAAVLASLDILKAECDVGLAHRCLLSTSGVTDPLVSALTRSASAEVAGKVLQTFISLTNGQPDVLTEDHIQLFCAKLRDEIGDAAVLPPVLHLLRNACFKHEGHRQACVANHLIELLMDILRRYKSTPDLVKSCCSSLRALTMDDDIRVPYGHGHEHAKAIVTENKGIKVLLELTKESSYEGSVVVKMFTLLSSLAVRNEFCQEIVDEGGLQLVIKVVMENLENQPLVHCSLNLIKVMARNDSVRDEIVKKGGVELVLSCMNKHQTEYQVCVASYSCLAAFALRSPNNCEKIVDAGGIAVIVTTMKINKENAALQKVACRVIRNMVSRTRPYSQKFLELGVEELISEARKRFPEVDDEAKVALRDLGCKVELKELWTGQKGSLDK